MKLGLYVLKFLAGIRTILLIATGNSYIYANGDMQDEENEEGPHLQSSHKKTKIQEDNTFQTALINTQPSENTANQKVNSPEPQYFIH